MGAPYPILMNGMSSNQGIWDTGATQNHEVGTRAALPDGRVFYYARNSGIALVAGQPVMAEVALAANTLAVNTAAIGDTTITVTSGTPTADANDFAGGYVNVVDELSEGVTLKIASHPAITATASIVISLKDPVPVLFAAASTVSLVKNPWMDCVVAAAGHVHFVAGVPNIAVAAGSTTKQYYWCQTWGVCGAWADATNTAIGAPLQSGTTEGQVEINDGAAQLIGTQVLISVDTEYQPVFLSIAP